MRGKWTGISTLAAAMAAGAVTSPLLGVLAPYLVSDLGIAVGSLGLGSSLYYIAAAALSPTAGALVERRGPRTALWLIAATTPLTVVAFAAAPTFPVLIVGVSLGAIPLALANPATNAAVARWVAPGRQGTAVGWKQAGVPAATLVVGLVGPAVADRVGWRLGALAAGAVIVVVLVGLLLLVPHRAVATLPAAPTPAGGGRAGRGRLGWLLPYAVLMGMAVGATNIYLVQFGVDAYGLRPAAAGRLAILMGLTGALARPLLAGVAERRGATTGVLAGLAALATVGVGLLAAGPSTGSAALVILATALVGVSVHAWNGVAMLRVVTHAGAGQVGGQSGEVMRAFYGGLLVGPLAFGQVAQRIGYGAGWVTVGVATAVACLLAARGGDRRWERPSRVFTRYWSDV